MKEILFSTKIPIILKNMSIKFERFNLIFRDFFVYLSLYNFLNDFADKPNCKIVPFRSQYEGKRGVLQTTVRRLQSGALGIGAMIIFIAMVLIAGIAAYIILSTGSELQTKSSTTGRETVQDVSTGIKISTIEGHNTSGLIDKIVIIITPRAGSPGIELDSTFIEIANSSKKCIIQYSSGFWVDGRSGLADLFSSAAFSPVASEFGLIVLKDDDGSCSQNTPVINQGDSVMMTLNTTVLFDGIPENENILGNIIPSEGAWSIIEFRTPSSFTKSVLILQED